MVGGKCSSAGRKKERSSLSGLRFDAPPSVMDLGFMGWWKTASGLIVFAVPGSGQGWVSDSGEVVSENGTFGGQCVLR